MSMRNMNAVNSGLNIECLDSDSLFPEKTKSWICAKSVCQERMRKISEENINMHLRICEAIRMFHAEVVPLMEICK